MPESCKSCGAELFTGARFCRFCGAQLAPLLTEELPTKVMTGGQPSADTGHVGPQTNPVFTAPPSYYPPAAFPQVVPRKHSPWGWILTFVALGLVGVAVLAVFLIARSHRPPYIPPPPPPPGKTEFAFAEGKKLYPLEPGAVVTIRGNSGEITIEGWDRQQAEVEVLVARDGRAERGRRELPVEITSDPGHLSLTTATRGLGRGANVVYKLKLPRELEHVTVKLNNGNVSLSDVSAIIEAEVDNGNIRLKDIVGSAETKVGNGNAVISFKEVGEDGPLSFVTGRGNIELKIGSSVNAELDAQTSMGDITIGPDFKVTMEKHMFVQRAFGQLGEGGRPLKIKVGIGDIEIAK